MTTSFHRRKFASGARRLTCAIHAERDSNKDKAVVFIFIIATAGLLIWAAIKPWAEKYINAARERNSYLALPSQEER
jgi:hypothetical protein